jgi:uncharacterized membrane protein YhhN
VTPLPALALATVILGLAGHLWADATGRRTARAACKVAASCGFIALGALSAHDRFGALVLAGLCLSAVGDALLLSGAERWFLAGVGVFLLAHLAYLTAFLPGSRVDPLAIAAVLAVGAGNMTWLWRRLGSMRIPVLAYTVAICLMLLFAVGTRSPLVVWGAILFAASDLTVARDRFIRPGMANRLVGLPLYYGAQLMLAWATRG